MSCEKYQYALIDLASNGTEATGDVRAHLAVCDLCCAELEQQQLLFASIDSAIRQTTNAPLPPALVHRFEARLARQTAPKAAFYPSSIYVGVALATAVSLMLVLPRTRTHDANRQTIRPVAPRQRTVTEPGKAVPAARHLDPMSTRHKRNPTSQPPRSPEPEILVPPDERIAFERFLSDLNGREDLAIALIKPMQEQHQARTAPVALPVPVEVPDIETVALTVQTLSEIADR
jgi:hypothetical protein